MYYRQNVHTNRVKSLTQDNNTMVLEKWFQRYRFLLRGTFDERWVLLSFPSLYLRSCASFSSGGRRYSRSKRPRNISIDRQRQKSRVIKGRGGVEGEEISHGLTLSSTVKVDVTIRNALSERATFRSIFFPFLFQRSSSSRRSWRSLHYLYS